MIGLAENIEVKSIKKPSIQNMLGFFTFVGKAGGGSGVFYWL
jgi:hypothetical protein